MISFSHGKAMKSKKKSKIQKEGSLSEMRYDYLLRYPVRFVLHKVWFSSLKYISKHSLLGKGFYKSFSYRDICLTSEMKVVNS